MAEHAYRATEQSQLRRLATLTDVVYAVALVLIIQWLPLPEESHAEGAVWLSDLFAEYATNMVAVLIGLVFVIMYWLRSNTLLTALDRTDSVHTALSIVSVFFLLFLLYVVRVSHEVAGPGAHVDFPVKPQREVRPGVAPTACHIARATPSRSGTSPSHRSRLSTAWFTSMERPSIDGTPAAEA